MSRQRQPDSPSFEGLQPASEKASAAARSASAKTNTRCELILRREVWRRGLRYRLHVPGIYGRPDVVFVRQRVVVFCDGDFWHGRELAARLDRLASGHNAPYWVAKISRNVQRDRFVTSRLESEGWCVIRLWESDINRNPAAAADRIEAIVRAVKVAPR